MKKLEKPVTLFAAIEESQHEALRFIAYKEKKSIAEIVREALEDYIKNVSRKYPVHAGKT
jgi:predicted HicB family RNase H-like nuclease